MTATDVGATPLLDVDRLDVAYGPVQVLFGVDLHVRSGEAVALLGTNGAGKSTVLRAISGLLTLSAGSITYDGRDITEVAADRRVALGIAHVAGGRATFPSLTVEENLRIGGYDFLGDRVRVSRGVERALELFPELAGRLSQIAGTLSGGEQQMMAIGRALVSDPRLLIIDELSLGLAPVVAGRILHAIDRLRERGMTMLVVEQSINVAARISDRAYFLEKGEVRFEGDTAALLDRGDLARSVFFGSAGTVQA
jgi:branched-chain amino acid transport system ATP-binding protein